ncbi:hypothetical protein CANARDRAFT_28379 [[Candida] arabinofermentans NRRL YB-2248]|uniref:DNA-directed RNA polymerase III subunit RPC4 n=1 Tax=[Candida] arabinofermentans NRRL YB-2248 TaxID=983967 RepID=A0A1E4T1I1_9ASCO|nr:hypothetical protein CANARDRAFT_28379 [[Candida] arabinofermentans NRRL YB-2248]
MSNPSQRLDSISRPSSATPANSSSTTTSSSSSTASSKPALKFKPKVVARKTKEERDANAPLSKPGIRINRGGLRGTGRGGRGGSGAGGARGGRGGGSSGPRHLQNTTIVASGPLSSGAVSLGNTVGNSRSHMSMGGGGGNSGLNASFLQKLKSKSSNKLKSSSGGTGAYSDDDDDDFIADENSARINMSQAYSWDEADTELFPIRAERTQHYEFGEKPVPDTSIKTEFHREASMPPLSESEPNTRENSVPPIPNIKKEVDDSLKLIPDESTASELVDTINDYQNKQERERLNEDYESIINFIESFKVEAEPSVELKKPIAQEDAENVDVEMATDEIDQVKQDDKESVKKLPNFMFVQMPSLLPTFESPSSSSSSTSSSSSIKVKKEQTTINLDDIEEEGEEKKKNKDNDNDNVNVKPSGQIGTLRYHKSGKVTMLIGNVVMDITRGGSTKLKQNIILVNDENQECIYLGDVDEKIIATPTFM